MGFAGLDARPDRGPDGNVDERTAVRLLGPAVRRDYRRRGIGRLHDHIEYVAMHERLRGRATDAAFWSWHSPSSGTTRACGASALHGQGQSAGAQALPARGLPPPVPGAVLRSTAPRGGSQAGDARSPMSGR